MKKIISIIAIPLLTPALASSQDVEYGHMNDGWHMMYYGYGGILMWLLMIALICLLVFLAVQLSKGSKNEKRSNDTPLDILKKRYAKGEINKEDFERMKQDLKS